MQEGPGIGLGHSHVRRLLAVVQRASGRLENRDVIAELRGVMPGGRLQALIALLLWYCGTDAGHRCGLLLLSFCSCRRPCIAPCAALRYTAPHCSCAPPTCRICLAAPPDQPAHAPVYCAAAACCRRHAADPVRANAEEAQPHVAPAHVQHVLLPGEHRTAPDPTRAHLTLAQPD